MMRLGCTPRRAPYPLLLLTLFVCLLAGVLAVSDGLCADATTTGWTVDRTTLPGTDLYRDPASGLVRSMIGSISFYGVKADPEDIARMFLSEYSDVFQVDASTSDLMFDGVVAGIALRHVRFHQEYEGIPVWRSSVVVHMTTDQRVVKADSRYLPGITLPKLIPTVDAETAETLARAAVASADDAFALGVETYDQPVLYIYAPDAKTLRLVWVVVVKAEGEAGHQQVVLDAEDGTVLDTRSTIVSATAPTRVFDPNPVATYAGNPNAPGTPTAIDAERKARTLSNLYSTSALKGPWAWVFPYSGPAATYPYDNYSYSNDHFEEVMAYYHIDQTKIYLQTIWPTKLAYQGQQIVVVNDLSLGHNAGYDPATHDIHMGRLAPYNDTAEDADVLLHEYSHAVLDYLNAYAYQFYYTEPIPGHTGSYPENQSRAIAEGYADFFAANHFAHVDPAFTRSNSDWYGDWAYYGEGLDSRRRLNNDLQYDSVGVSPESIRSPYVAAPFWSHLLWWFSQSLGQQDMDRLGLEWAGTVAQNSNWVDAANSLITADQALLEMEDPEDRPFPWVSHRQLLVSTLAAHHVPNLSDASMNAVHLTFEIEHGDLSQLRIYLGVSDNATPRHDLARVLYRDYLSLPAGPGRVVFVVPSSEMNALVSYFPPSTSRVWYVEVQEDGTNPTLHEQGVVRNLYVWRGVQSYPVELDGGPRQPIPWVPILEGDTVRAEVSDPMTTPAHYAEITLGHSDLSQL